jgi:hypothetical protein
MIQDRAGEELRPPRRPGADDIWFVPLEGVVRGEPVNLGKPVNSPGDEARGGIGVAPR